MVTTGALEKICLKERKLTNRSKGNLSFRNTHNLRILHFKL